MSAPNPENVTVAISIEPQARAMGAGWLLPNGGIVTCNHVVKEADEVWVRYRTATPRKYRVAERLPQSQTTDPSPADIGDLALLSPVDEADGWNAASRYVADLSKPGDEVVSFGFPEERPNGRTGDGTVGSHVKGRLEIVGSKTEGQRLTQGFSGGPVLSAGSARVLGVFAATHHESERGYLIPAKEIEAWLRKVGENSSADFVSVPVKWPSRAIREIRESVFGGLSPAMDYELQVVLQSSKSGLPRPEQAESYGDEHLSPLAFVREAREDGGRMVIFADGGGGKSSFLVKLAEELEMAAVGFVWLDLKQLGDPGGETLATILAKSDPQRMNDLVRKGTLGPLPGNFLQPAEHLVFIADGLNEVGASATLLLAALDEFVRATSNVSLVSTVRSTTSLKEANVAKAFALAPLSRREIERITRRQDWNPAFYRFFGSPQLMNLAVKLDAFHKPHRHELFSSYLHDALGKALASAGKPELPVKTALDALALHSYRLLARGLLTLKADAWNEDFANALEDVMSQDSANAIPGDQAGLAAKLTEELGQSVLVRDATSQQIGFQHSLIGEWLAARYFVSLGPDGWTSNGFKAVSLEDSSDDGLRLALDMVEPHQAEQFLLRMYDWRWQRVLAFSTEGVTSLSEPLHDALVGLNGLRLCDWFQHTRDQVRPFIQARSDDGSEFAHKLLEASKVSGDELFAVVRDRFSGPAESDPAAHGLERWVELLALDSPAGARGLDALFSDDAFLGWSASNILRLRKVAPEALDTMRAAYAGSFATACSLAPQEVAEGFDRLEAGVGLRWRIAHTVGRAVPAQQIPEGESFLFSVWENEREHRDVRFGACRSLLEIALGYPDRRKAIFDRFEAALRGWSARTDSLKKWREDAQKAAEQLWRAWPPAADSIPGDDRRDWDVSLRKVLEAARAAADSLGWRRGELDATFNKIEGEGGG